MDREEIKWKRLNRTRSWNILNVTLELLDHVLWSTGTHRRFWATQWYNLDSALQRLIWQQCMEAIKLKINMIRDLKEILEFPRRNRAKAGTINTKINAGFWVGKMSTFNLILAHIPPKEFYSAQQSGNGIINVSADKGIDRGNKWD